MPRTGKGERKGSLSGQEKSPDHARFPRPDQARTQEGALPHEHVPVDALTPTRQAHPDDVLHGYTETSGYPTAGGYPQPSEQAQTSRGSDQDALALRDVRRRLSEQGWEGERLVVEVQNHIASIRGEVADETERCRVLEAVSGSPHVHEVRDGLHVRRDAPSWKARP
jgi:hypothetical protein